MRRTSSPPPHIQKFGGASLADAASMRHAATIVPQQPEPKVVVISAMAGVTDVLLDVAARAVRGDLEPVRSAAQALRTRHTETARALLRRGPDLDALVQLIDTSIAELEQLAGGLAVLRELTPRTV